MWLPKVAPKVPSLPCQPFRRARPGKIEIKHLFNRFAASHSKTSLLLVHVCVYVDLTWIVSGVRAFQPFLSSHPTVKCVKQHRKMKPIWKKKINRNWNWPRQLKTFFCLLFLPNGRFKWGLKEYSNLRHTRTYSIKQLNRALSFPAKCFPMQII